MNLSSADVGVRLGWSEGAHRLRRRFDGYGYSIHIFIPIYWDAVGLITAKLCRETGNAEIDIEDLQTFVEVADAGGGARRLGVSKSIVSPVASLESSTSRDTAERIAGLVAEMADR